jgi:N-acetylneuraminic acid mutarotase
MKTIITLLWLLLAVCLNGTAQNVWSARSDLPVFELMGAKSFSIGGKGYVVTGMNGSGVQSIKLWEYDQATNTWSAKSDFPGTPRTDAVAFSIGSKGYIGTGNSVPGSNPLADFWEWDQATDTWTQKANFGGTPRYHAAGFAVSGKGYIATGWDNTMQLKNDVWEYNPATNAWAQKAAFPDVRYGAAGFAIGTKGYICSGNNGAGTDFPNDLYEFDPAANTWTVKAPLPASGGSPNVGKDFAFSFVIGTKGYLGAGTFVDQTIGFMPMYCRDFWEWDQATNTWTQLVDFPGSYRQWSVGFSIGNKGYAGTGEYVQGYYHDLWEYGSPSAAGIDESPAAGTVSVYPNPAADQLVILARETGDYGLYDATGQKVFDLSLTMNEPYSLSLETLSAGMYLLQSAGDHPSVRKIIVSK